MFLILNKLVCIGRCRVVEVSARDYVTENAVEAAVAPMKRQAAAGDDGRRWLCKGDYGLVPDYLQRLRLDMATQAAQQEVGPPILSSVVQPTW